MENYFEANRYDIVQSYREELTFEGDYRIINNDIVEIKTDLRLLKVPPGITSISADCDTLEIMDFSDADSYIPTKSLISYCSQSNIKQLIYNNKYKNIPDKFMVRRETLKSVVNLKDVESIGEACFAGAENLRHIDSLTNIREIGYGAFAKCTNLTKIELGEKLHKLGEYSFKNSGIVTIKLKGTLKEISRCCFEGCNSLQRVVLSENIKSIEDNAFYKCENLMMINFPLSLHKIKYCAFDSCTTLRHVQLNQGLRYIGEYAFAHTAIEKLVIPKTVWSIGEDCFRGCKYLKELHLPKHLALFKKRMSIPSYTQVQYY